MAITSDIRIVMPRGDIFPVRFKIYDTEEESETTTIDFTQIFMSCKKYYKQKDVLFQKSLSRGSIVKIGDGDYQFIIEPEDTNNLPFGEYVIDIELIYENVIKQTICGTLRLTEEVTTVENEVR